MRSRSARRFGGGFLAHDQDLRRAGRGRPTQGEPAALDEDRCAGARIRRGRLLGRRRAEHLLDRHADDRTALATEQGEELPVRVMDVSGVVDADDAFVDAIEQRIELLTAGTLGGGQRSDALAHVLQTLRQCRGLGDEAGRRHDRRRQITTGQALCLVRQLRERPSDTRGEQRRQRADDQPRRQAGQGEAGQPFEPTLRNPFRRDTGAEQRLGAAGDITQCHDARDRAAGDRFDRLRVAAGGDATQQFMPRGSGGFRPGKGGRRQRLQGQVDGGPVVPRAEPPPPRRGEHDLGIGQCSNGGAHDTPRRAVGGKDQARRPGRRRRARAEDRTAGAAQLEIFEAAVGPDRARDRLQRRRVALRQADRQVRLLRQALRRRGQIATPGRQAPARLDHGTFGLGARIADYRTADRLEAGTDQGGS